MIGVSQSTLADYELGNTKFVPPDKVKIMSDIYNRPDLMTYYCKHECPIGEDLPLATEIPSIECIAIHLLKSMKNAKLKLIKEQLVDIAADGNIEPEDLPILENIAESLNEVAIDIHRMQLLVKSLRKEGNQNG